MPHRWNSSAELRRKQIESGIDLTFNEVFKPFFIKLISSLSPRNILEVGSGTGHLSKSLSELGFTVTAIEPSWGMYEVSKNVLSRTNVTLLNCEASALKNDNFFHLSFSHLVAHVVENLADFNKSIAQNLESDGYFIFSIPHPCFYNDYKMLFGDEYNYMTPTTKNISFTITKDWNNPISGVPYHHRPLSEYFNQLVSSGFSIERFDEIYPDDQVQAKYGKTWEHPRYCVFTCKKI